ncbi:nuclear receptor subfamily 4 group A member 2a [Lates japonicus]|uniref:Nuclear receptor subfamily 4 group A member 2a n=1 Tax=Lates japonicus TaxID=270547 RepID=A0AAD3R1X4_LATJO|nr:nuclear receptor subfamily 4 group A member 2a [Lates japonicus]
MRCGHFHMIDQRKNPVSRLSFSPSNSPRPVPLFPVVDGSDGPLHVSLRTEDNPAHRGLTHRAFAVPSGHTETGWPGFSSLPGAGPRAPARTVAPLVPRRSPHQTRVCVCMETTQLASIME